jgi:hypothetical protein
MEKAGASRSFSRRPVFVGRFGRFNRFVHLSFRLKSAFARVA